MSLCVHVGARANTTIDPRIWIIFDELRRTNALALNGRQRRAKPAVRKSARASVALLVGVLRERGTTMCISRRSPYLWSYVLLCLPVTLGLSACTIHQDSEPPAQSAPLAVAPAPVAAPVAAAPIVAAPATAPARQQPGETYRPTVEAPTAPARGPTYGGAASAPPATHVATAPAAGVAVAPAAGVASAPPASGYADDPAIVVNGAPPAPRVEYAPPMPGAGYAWVPGHWAWRGSWVWAPGGWKPIPAGRRQWVAGAWVTQGAQSRWQPGYWA
jgi:hypothetical protein